MSMTQDELREVVARKMAVNPMMKTSMLCEVLDVPEVEILRVLSPERVTELKVDDLEVFVRSLEQLGALYIISRSNACVAEIKGRFGGVSKKGPYLNVSGENLHLHIRHERIASIFRVITLPGPKAAPMLSLQFFNTHGDSVLKVYLLESIKKEFDEDFESALNQFDLIVESFCY